MHTYLAVLCLILEYLEVFSLAYYYLDVCVFAKMTTPIGLQIVRIYTHLINQSGTNWLRCCAAASLDEFRKCNFVRWLGREGMGGRVMQLQFFSGRNLFDVRP